MTMDIPATMKAVVFEKVGQWAVRQVPTPRLTGPTDLLVKVLACGICGTDNQILLDPPGAHATPGVIIGHEMVAEVVAVGDAVDAFQPGDLVVGDNNLPCGHCTMCHGGQYNECASLRSMGEDIDGFMCQYQVMPQSQAIRLPAGTPVDTAALTEPVNCAMGALQKLDLRPGKSYAVLGCGPIGLMFVALLKASGASHIVASDLSAERLAMAEELGADILCDRGSDPVATCRNATDGIGVDAAIDVVGCLLPQALDCVRKGGDVIAFGLNAHSRQTIDQADLAMRGVTIHGTFIGHFTFETTARMLAAGVVDLRRLITDRFDIDDFGEALAALRSGSSCKVVIYPNGR